MYAVIKSGGKQYRAEVGQTLKLEKLSQPAGEVVSLGEVLLIADNGTITLGKPFIKGASVSGKVLEHGRGKKIRIIKHRRRKHYHREQGHRQAYTAVQIEAING